jgi:eukaryotic-like serine/threonine-protein kinase
LSDDRTRSAGFDGLTAANSRGILNGPPGYELRDEVGRGGMGVVYRAWDVALGRDVAIKLLADRYATDSAPAKRFVSEARITGQLQHPGIPAVHQVGATSDGRPFLAMKLIKGRTFDAMLKDRQDPSADRGQLLAVFEAVCQAIGYAHAHRVIHRDIKPTNVMVGAFGEVQVMDWGLAKVLGEAMGSSSSSSATDVTRAETEVSPAPEAGSQTQAGSLVGTPAFIPPEQAAGEIDRVDARSDVFGLGALLAVVLTGKPPYIGETAEALRVLAVRGKLDDCFSRLDVCGAEPDLIELCKRCLAFEPNDRPRDGGEVAQTVAGLRSAADERARSAEQYKVAADARAEEQRRKRRWQIVAASVVAAALIGGIFGLGSYLRAQTRANADLAAKNAELAAEQAKVEKRFELAQKAIAKLHTGVGEDMLLKSDQFRELRTQLLREAADFYGDLERLLEGQTDAKSRRLLADGYYQLAELTGEIGQQPDALALHRKALAVRRELADAPGADIETRLDVARSLGALAYLLLWSDMDAALRTVAEQHDVITTLVKESPTEAVLAVLGQQLRLSGNALSNVGKTTEALAATEEAAAILAKLSNAKPADIELQYDLARSRLLSGLLLSEMGRRPDSSAAFESGCVMLQRLAADHPLVSRYRYRLGQGYEDIAENYLDEGKPSQALAAIEKARVITRALTNTHPAVSVFQGSLASNDSILGRVQAEMGKPVEAMAAFEKAQAIEQKMARDNPTDIWAQIDLAANYNRMGELLAQIGRPDEALHAYEQARTLLQKPAHNQTAFREVERELATSLDKTGPLLAASGQPEKALSACRKALEIRQKLTGVQPSLPRLQWELAGSHSSLGTVQRRTGRPADAAESFRRALALLDQLATPTPRNHFSQACCHAQLAGLATEKESGLPTGQGGDSAARAVAELRQAYSGGFGIYLLRVDTSLDSLRTREDFKRLLAEVETLNKGNTANNKETGAK